MQLLEVKATTSGAGKLVKVATTAVEVSSYAVEANDAISYFCSQLEKKLAQMDANLPSFGVMLRALLSLHDRGELISITFTKGQNIPGSNIKTKSILMGGIEGVKNLTNTLGEATWIGGYLGLNAYGAMRDHNKTIYYASPSYFKNYPTLFNKGSIYEGSKTVAKLAATISAVAFGVGAVDTAFSNCANSYKIQDNNSTDVNTINNDFKYDIDPLGTTSNNIDSID